MNVCTRMTLLLGLLCLLGCSGSRSEEVIVEKEMTHSELEAAIRDHLRSVYPNIAVRVGVYEKNPSRLAVYFVEDKFKDLYPLQRFHYLMHNIPDDFWDKHLSNSIWFELAPGESPDDLKYPDEEIIEEITPDVMKVLTKAGFFSSLDDIMAPESPERTPNPCGGDFNISKSILKQKRFTEEEMFDIFHVMMAQGGYCDCEILYNVSEESRLKAHYWQKRAEERSENK